MSAEKISADMLAIIPSAMRAIRAEMRGLAQPELSVAQFRILARLDFKPHSNNELAEWVGVSKAAMSRTIDLLVNRGLVQRTHSVFDRRELILSLTKAGKQKFQAIEDATMQKLIQRLEKESGANRKRLEAGLEALREVFGE